MATIKEIRTLLEQITDVSDDQLSLWLTDHRKGVVNAAKKRQRELLALQRQKERLEELLQYETQLYQKGVTMIAGIDEVGRGPLAGPVVAAAVILPQNSYIVGLDDSKKIPKAKHEKLYQEVLDKAVAVGIGMVSPEIIDEVNIYKASQLAMLEALKNLSHQPEHLLIDAMTLDTPLSQTSLIKGDARSLSIAAASIVAKVTRDRLMASYDQLYPGYGFGKHAGYGTKAHLLALKTLGVTPIHRKTFEPIKSMLNDQNE